MFGDETVAGGAVNHKGFRFSRHFPISRPLTVAQRSAGGEFVQQPESTGIPVASRQDELTCARNWKLMRAE
jgi:hypothetical protein